MRLSDKRELPVTGEPCAARSLGNTIGQRGKADRLAHHAAGNETGEELKKPDRLVSMMALASCVFALLAIGCGSGVASPDGATPDDGDLMVGLITKTEANPFFAAMEEGARRRAGELGV